MKDPKHSSSEERMWQVYKQGGLRTAISSMFGMQNAQQQAFIRSALKEQRRTSLFEVPLEQLEVVIFDLETTGFNPYNGDEIISVGAVAATGENIAEDETFYSLVNPKRAVPANISDLTGITDEMAHKAPEMLNVLQQFFQFVQRRVLIAHGTGHDKQFLNAALWRTTKTNLTHRVIDTIMIAKWLYPKLKDYSLDRLLSLYDIPITNRHHALEDSLMTAQLWSCFLKEIKNRHVITLGDLYSYLSRH